jgi:hypothetical protein
MLARGAALLPVPASGQAPRELENNGESLVFESEPVDADDASVELASAAKHAPRARAGRSKAPAQIFVSADQVRLLASRAAPPTGRFVAAAGERPIGLQLAGVAALGIGLEDGDILTEAMGQAAVNADAIVKAVIAARAQKTRFLSGSVWRRGKTLRIVVEQPY